MFEDGLIGMRGLLLTKRRNLLDLGDWRRGVL